MNMETKAQTISADAMIAVGLFTVAIIMFFSFSGDSIEERKAEDLQTESSKLFSSLSGTRNVSQGFLSGTKVDKEKLEKLTNLTYNQLKQAVGLSADFCIYFEDSESNLIEIREGVSGLGSRYVEVAGTLCGRGLNTAEVILCEEADAASECPRVVDFGLTPQQCCTFSGVCCL
jgi:D-aminopeptidase